MPNDKSFARDTFRTQKLSSSELLPKYDETDPDYDKFLLNGPVKVLDDVEHGMDGTVKHFVCNQGSLERVCDYIQDRYGNQTNLTYTQTTVGGSTVNLLQSVTDPSGRQILYTWTNLGTQSQPAWLTTLASTWNWKGQFNQWQQSNLLQNAYSYDNSGQRLTNAITSGGSTRTEQYGYDELNRLKSVDYVDGQTQSYSFDSMGNRLSKSDIGGGINGTEGYTYNAANMLLSRAANAYTNDLDGNTLTGGGRTNTWDSQNRLVQCVNGVNTSSFVYGADGLRRQSTINGTTTDFVLDNSMFVREKNHATGSNIATYLVGAREPEYRRDDVAGTVRWYLYDGLGSVLGEVDPNGTITSSRKYDVYGAVRGGVNPTGSSKHKFVGQLGHPSDDETGLIYMRARSYDTVVGRFVSEDPAYSGRNWYIYASGSFALPVQITEFWDTL